MIQEQDTRYKIQGTISRKQKIRIQNTEFLRQAQQRMDTKDIKSIYFSIFSSCEIKILISMQIFTVIYQVCPPPAF